MFFSAAFTANRSRVSSRQSASPKGVFSISILPDSILEKSRMSLMIVSSASLEVRIVFT